GLNLINSIAFPLAISIFVIFFLKHPSKLFFTKIKFQYIESYLIETLRSWGKIFWWGFLLIIPGFYKFISYSFVPFVVLMNKNYDQGLIDALKESEKVFLQKKGSTLITLFIFQLLLPIMLSSLLDSYQNFNETPMSALLCSAVQGLISLMGFLILMQIYIDAETTTLTA
ncbi:MAG: hypothetical protein KDD45_06025, partial [Bdellovibrionales bacterium]|nr:hypothetical protein [Bdellovibrionales bacterium]